MKTSLRRTITACVLISSFSLVGVSCQKQEDPATQTTGTLDTSGTTSLPTDTGTTTTTEPFTVDLLPSDTDDTLPINNQLGAGALDGTTTTTDSPFDVDEIDPSASSGSSAGSTGSSTGSSSSSAVSDGDLEAFIDRVMTQFGTFTNQDRIPFQNLVGLENDVTQSMQAYLDSLMAGGVDEDAPFFGRTSTVLSQTVLQDRATDTRVLVVIEREDVAGASATPKLSYVTYVVRVVEDQDGYLLDGLYEISVGQNPFTDSE